MDGNRNNRGAQRIHRWRPGTVSLRMAAMEEQVIGPIVIPRNQVVRQGPRNLDNEDVPILIPRNGVEDEQGPAGMIMPNPWPEVPDYGNMDPVMERMVEEALDRAKAQSQRSIMRFKELVYGVFKQDGLNVTVQSLSRFLVNLGEVDSFMFWNGGNTTSLVRFFGYLFKRIKGLRQIWNCNFHSTLAYLESAEMEYLARFYVAALKKRIILPQASLWSNVGDWLPSLSTFFAALFQKLHHTFPEHVLAKNLKQWGIIELITNNPWFARKLSLAMEGIANRDQVISLINRLCYEMIVDMASSVLKDIPDNSENLVIAKAIYSEYSNQQLVEMIWAGIIKRVKSSRVKANRVRTFNSIPRILANREQFRMYIHVNKLGFLSAMSFPEDLTFLVEEMNTFIGGCLHYGIIKPGDIHVWKLPSDGHLFDIDNPCHRFLLDMDLSGL